MGEWAGADVCIVGGGPAGLAAAIALRREGFAVAVVDCAAPPIDKACGEGLMPEGLRALKKLGVELPAGIGFPLAGVRFINGKTCVTAPFPHDAALGLRRTVLHQLLLDRAAKLGIALEWNAKNVRLMGERLSINGQVTAPKLIVGADGQHSRLRCEAGLNQFRREARRYGFRRHYRISPWSPYVELHWGKRCQIYVTPISHCEVGVALLSPDPKLRLKNAFDEFPELKSGLAFAQPCSSEMGAITGSRVLAHPCRNGLALIGDASGSVDAITGEGMSLAFRQALALAKAFKAGDLRQYDRAHRNLSRRPRRMASLLLLAAAHGNLRSRAFAGLAKYPEIFASLLAIHVGELPFSRLFRRG